MEFMWWSENQFPQTDLFSASTGDYGNQVSDSGGPACRTDILTNSCHGICNHFTWEAVYGSREGQESRIQVLGFRCCSVVEYFLGMLKA